MGHRRLACGLSVVLLIVFAAGTVLAVRPSASLSEVRGNGEDDIIKEGQFDGNEKYGSYEDAVRKIEYLSGLTDEALVGDAGFGDYLDVAITASRLIDPTLDGDSIRKQIDDMAEEASLAWSSSGVDPQKKIEALNRVIFETNGFVKPSYDAPILTGKGIFDTYALPGLLKGKEGFCEGLSTVYFLVGSHANLPVSIVNLPVHTMIRVDFVAVEGNGTEPGTTTTFYVESTESGDLRSPEEIRHINGAKDAAASTPSNVYFSPLNHSQFLNLHVNALAYGLAMQEDGPHPLTENQLVRLADAIVRLEPDRPESLDTAAMIYYQMGDLEKARSIVGRAGALAERYGAPGWVLDHYYEAEEKYKRGDENGDM